MENIFWSLNATVTDKCKILNVVIIKNIDTPYNTYLIVLMFCDTQINNQHVFLFQNRFIKNDYIFEMFQNRF